MTTYNPDSGSATSSTTFVRSDSTDQDFRFGCAAQPFALRQMLNEDFTQVAIALREPSDGSYHVGVLDGRGQATDLTDPPRGFSGTPYHRFPLFQPGTARLWYLDNRELASVDPEDRTDRRVHERVDDGRMSENGFFFTPRGQYVEPWEFGIASPMDPSRQYRLSATSNSGLNLTLRAAPDQVTFLDMPAACVPRAWIDGQRTLCTSDTQAYVVTLTEDRQSVTQVAITPPAGDRTISTPIPAPDGQRFAFLSAVGTTTTLYVGYLDGRTPTEVVQLNSPDASRAVRYL